MPRKPLAQHRLTATIECEKMPRLATLRCLNKRDPHLENPRGKLEVEDGYFERDVLWSQLIVLVLVLLPC